MVLAAKKLQILAVPGVDRLVRGSLMSQNLGVKFGNLFSRCKRLILKHKRLKQLDDEQLKDRIKIKQER